MKRHWQDDSDTTATTDADRLFEQGWQLHRAGDYGAAIALLDRARAIHHRLGDATKELLSILSIAACFGDWGRNNEAAKHYEQVVPPALADADYGLALSALSGLGMCHEAEGRFVQAIDCYEQGLALGRQVQDRQAVTRLLGLLARCHQRQAEQLADGSDPLPGYFTTRDEETAPRAGGSRSAEALGLFEQGFAESEEEHFGEALGHFQRALALSVVDGDQVTEAMTLNSIGVTHRRLGQYSAALDFLHKARSIAEQTGDRLIQYSAFHNLATVHSYQEQYPAALKNYQRALAVSRELGDKSMESHTLRGMAGACLEMGRPEESLEYLRQALAAVREVADRAAEGVVLRSIAQTYQHLANQGLEADAVRLLQQGRDEFERGNSEAAMGPLQMALDIFDDVVAGPDEPESESKRAGARGRVITLVTFGDVYAGLNRHHEAVGYYEKALSAQRDAGLDMEGTLLARLGESCQLQGLYAQALDFYREGLAVRRSERDSRGEAFLLNKMGTCYYQLGDLNQASLAIDQSLRISRDFGDRAAVGTLLNNIGSVYAHRQQYQQARDALLEALEIARQRDDQSLEARVLNNLGLVQRAEGRADEAKSSFESSLAISREIGDGEHESRSLAGIQGLAEPLTNLGGPASGNRLLADGLGKLKEKEYRAAGAALDGALREFQQDGYNLGIGLALLGIGLAREGRFEYERAILALEQALNVFRRLGSPVRGESIDIFAFLAFGDDSGVTFTQRKLGEVYRHLGEYPKALAFFEAALDAYVADGDLSGQCVCWNAIGMTALQIGQYQRALEAIEQSLVTSRAAASPVREIESQCAMSLVYSKLRQYEKAFDCLRLALIKCRESSEPSQVASVQMALGQLYDCQGRHEEALAGYDVAASMSRQAGERQVEAVVLNYQGIVCEHLGRLSDSVAYHLRSVGISREVGDSSNEGYALSNLGYVYMRLGRLDDALSYYAAALEIARRLHDRSLEQLVLSNRGDAYRGMGAVVEAERDFVAAIGIQETLHGGLADLNRVSLSDSYTRTYLRLQQILVEQNRIEEALEIAERGRARAFVELLIRGDATVESLARQPSYPTAEQIKAIARQQEATVIEYSIIQEENTVYIWVIDPQGEVHFGRGDIGVLFDPGFRPAASQHVAREGEQSLLTRAVETALSELSRREAMQRANADRLGSGRLRRLYQLLIAPVEVLLPTAPNSKLVVVPFGELFMVPFAALQDASGRYLVESFTVATVPSIQVLDLTASGNPAAAEASSPALIVGNPVMPVIPWTDPPRRLTSLPGSKEEAEAIAYLFGVKALIGAAATKQAVTEQMPGAQVIHFATHGMLEDIQQVGVPGAIALAPTGEDDGWLTAGEIMRLRLSAELVVLSACKTGQGRITGDGVVGLSRALVAAGVPTVVVSLWEVSDRVTASLMRAFYRQLKSGQQMGPALRRAMLATMDEHPDPRDWAAFALIGQARSMLTGSHEARL